MWFRGASMLMCVQSFRSTFCIYLNGLQLSIWAILHWFMFYVEKEELWRPQRRRLFILNQHYLRRSFGNLLANNYSQVPGHRTSRYNHPALVNLHLSVNQLRTLLVGLGLCNYRLYKDKMSWNCKYLEWSILVVIELYAYTISIQNEFFLVLASAYPHMTFYQQPMFPYHLAAQDPPH